MAGNGVARDGGSDPMAGAARRIAGLPLAGTRLPVGWLPVGWLPRVAPGEWLPGGHVTGRRQALLGLAGTVAALGLAGCTPTGFPPACPQLSLIKNASDLVRFGGNGNQRDIRNLVLTARIQSVPASCRFSGAHTVGAQIRVMFSVQRGPAATSPDVELHYFVAAAKGELILDEQDYIVKGVFPSNVDRMTLVGEVINLDFPVGSDQSAAGYHIYVGFRLTKAELDANRAQGI